MQIDENPRLAGRTPVGVSSQSWVGRYPHAATLQCTLRLRVARGSILEDTDGRTNTKTGGIALWCFVNYHVSHGAKRFDSRNGAREGSRRSFARQATGGLGCGGHRPASGAATS